MQRRFLPLVALVTKTASSSIEHRLSSLTLPAAASLAASNSTPSFSIKNIQFANMSSSMARGHNGRIEEAFAAAKDRGEAAFVTFVTAGFPTQEGELY